MSYVAPSNFHVDLVGVPLDQAIRIVFLDAIGGTAKGYQNFPATNIGDREKFTKPRLLLHWTMGSTVGHLPAPLTCEQVIPIVQAWIDGLPRDAYGPQPDIDGTIKAGFRVRSGDYYSYGSVICGIEPEWLEWGK